MNLLITVGLSQVATSSLRKHCQRQGRRGVQLSYLVNFGRAFVCVHMCVCDKLLMSIRLPQHTTQGARGKGRQRNPRENPVCSCADTKVHHQEVRCYLATCSHTSKIDFRSISALESSLLRTIAQKQKSIRDFFY